MRVAIFTDTYLPQVNGVTNTISNMEKYFEKKNIEYIILAPEYDSKLKLHNVETFFSIKFLMYPECRLSVVTGRRVNQILLDFKPDLVHSVTEFNMGWAGLSYAIRNKIPCITTYTTNYSQYLNYFKLHLFSKAVWEYFKWFHNQSDLTVCPSKVTRNILLERGLEKVEIWGRGIDSSHFSPSKRSYLLREGLRVEDKIVLLYVGRVSAEKDLDILFESYHQIKREYPSRVALVVAGDGPMKEKYQSQNEDVIFTGYLKGKELACLYASADIFTFPSSTETFGNVVLEAMASGIPVVAVDAGGVRENIIDGYNGLLCRPRDSQSFYNGIKMVIDNRSIRMQMGKNARHFAVKRDWEEVFDRLTENYKDIINRRKREKAA